MRRQLEALSRGERRLLRLGVVTTIHLTLLTVAIPREGGRRAGPTWLIHWPRQASRQHVRLVPICFINVPKKGKKSSLSF